MCHNLCLAVFSFRRLFGVSARNNRAIVRAGLKREDRRFGRGCAARLGNRKTNILAAWRRRGSSSRTTSNRRPRRIVGPLGGMGLHRPKMG